MISQKLQKTKLIIVLFSPLVLLFFSASFLFYILAIQPLKEVYKSEYSVFDLNKRIVLTMDLQKEREFLLHTTISNQSLFNEIKKNIYGNRNLNEQELLLTEELLQKINYIRNNPKDGISLYEVYRTYTDSISNIIRETKIYYKYKISDIELYRFLLGKTIFFIILENAYKEKEILFLLNFVQIPPEIKQRLFKEFLEAVELQKLYTIGMINISPEKFREKLIKIKNNNIIQNIRNQMIINGMQPIIYRDKEIQKIYNENIQSLLDFYQYHHDEILFYLKEKKNAAFRNFFILSFISLIPFALFLWSAYGVREYYKNIEMMAIKDPLTELYNIRYFRFIVQNKFKESKKTNNSLSLLLLDLDNFKQINDQYGHEVGDKVLWEFSEILRSYNHNFYVFRYGGDEFIILMPNTSKDKAIAFSKQLKEVINQKEIMIDSHNIIKIQFSMGIASYPEDVNDHHQLLRSADALLLLAKQAGKNIIQYI